MNKRTLIIVGALVLAYFVGARMPGAARKIGVA